MKCQGMDAEILGELARVPKSVLIKVLQKKENQQDGKRKHERWRDFKELTHRSAGLASLNSAGQATLKTQGRVDFAVLRPKAVWSQNSFFLREPQCFSLEAFN